MAGKATKSKDGLIDRLAQCEKSLTIFMDNFLMTNRRVDRDKVIKLLQKELVILLEEKGL